MVLRGFNRKKYKVLLPPCFYLVTFGNKFVEDWCSIFYAIIHPNFCWISVYIRVVFFCYSHSVGFVCNALSNVTRVVTKQNSTFQNTKTGI